MNFKSHDLPFLESGFQMVEYLKWSPTVLLMSIINPDGIGSWLWVASQGKVKDRQTVWQIRSIVVIKLLNTFTFFDYHCTSNHYLSSSTQASKSPLFATATRESANFEGELTSENPFSIQSKSLSPHVSSTFSSIACLYRRACFSKAIFHLGQVTCRSGLYREEFPSHVTKGFLCILNTFSWLLGVNNKENGRSGIFLTTKILFWCAAATLQDDFHDKNLPR